MRWQEAHRSAMLAAAHAHKDFDVDTTRRVDVFSVIEKAELILGFQPLPKLSGAYFAGAGVLINSNHPLARQRYTAGHEFGHHVFGHQTSVDPLVDPLARWGAASQWSPDEKQAEAFAAWFLMPKKLVYASLEQLELDRPQTAEDVYAVALRLGTSFVATARHLNNLRLVDRQSLSGWLNVHLADVKRTLSVGAPPDSLRNDVWRLDERDNGLTLAVRPGDRLVIELADIPSSGYVWEPAGDLQGDGVVTDSFRTPLQIAEPDLADANDGGVVSHVFVVEISDTSAFAEEPIVFERVRPWTGDVIDRYQLSLDIQAPRRGIAEEWLRIAA